MMKRASLVEVSTTTLFYMLCGCISYAAFGNDAPGNFLTGFGFYEPFWLIDIALNVCIAIHLIGAYQEFRLCLSPNVVDHPLGPATDHRLCAARLAFAWPLRLAPARPLGLALGAAPQRSSWCIQHSPCGLDNSHIKPTKVVVVEGYQRGGRKGIRVLIFYNS
ncbi:hypothetical protein R6Q59_019007 [Mikania micrantha]